MRFMTKLKEEQTPEMLIIVQLKTINFLSTFQNIKEQSQLNLVSNFLECFK
jgi:hypothetical protein